MAADFRAVERQRNARSSGLDVHSFDERIEKKRNYFGGFGLRKRIYSGEGLVAQVRRPADGEVSTSLRCTDTSARATPQLSTRKIRQRQIIKAF